MGPLAGLRIIEVASIGPGPFCGMLFGDLGADVIRIDRPPHELSGEKAMQMLDPLRRNRRSIALNLKSEAGIEVLLRLTADADALVEGFRPGVAERLGFGPEICLKINPRLVYGRVTGWGQEGPLAQAAGHDLNYLALSGALHAFGPADGPPVPPLNLLADFGGGGLLLAFGIVCALLDVRRSGRGQVVDAAMLDGVNAFMAMFHGLGAAGQFDEQSRSHFLSGAAHYYATYETRDGKYISVAALEPGFYRELIERAGLDAELFSGCGLNLQSPTASVSAELKAELAKVFRSRTRDEWCALLEGTEACFAPVLTVSEASRHPHHVARRSFTTVGGVLQSSPVPRFSATPPGEPRPPRNAGADCREILGEAGYSALEIARLLDAGVVLEP
ncbi:MAG: CaiB/BaiF CoA-transferase family protein [Gammaproteobacteria bacterium]